MPGRDRTGARGMGPMGGKAAGYCFEPQAQRPASPDPDSGMGRGQGRGLGGGRRGRFRGGIAGIADAAPTANREQELEMLKQQAEDLKAASEKVSARIQEMEADTKHD